MIIVGMTACGKTHYLLDMLEKEYKNHYDYIFIVCPTLEDNKTYQQWKYLTDPDVYELPVTHDNVENILREVTHFAKNTTVSSFSTIVHQAKTLKTERASS